MTASSSDMAGWHTTWMSLFLTGLFLYKTPDHRDTHRTHDGQVSQSFWEGLGMDSCIEAGSEGDLGVNVES